jgi:hypothetical protein
MSMGAASVPTIRAVRPRPVFAVLSQIVLFAAVPAAFLGSPALLYALGINYAGAGGNPLEKIHIATLLALVALGFSVLPDGRMQFSRLSPSVFFWLISLIGFASGQLLVLGRPLSGLVVTFLTPVLLLYLVGEARPSALRTLRRLLLLLLLANSLVGLVEVATDEALLPRVAGAFEIESDGRALGLVGNPLMAGFLAGIGVLHLVIGGATRGFRRFAPVEILVHGAALLAFGGRLALVATVLLLVAFVLFDTRAFAQRSVGQRVALRGFLVLGLLACGLAGLTAGLADDILGRMVDDGGSASTRWAALTLAAQLPPEALLFGLPPGPRADMLAAFDTPFGIEITWIGWLVDYGIIIALVLLAALALILRACLVGADRVHLYMTAYFLICISGAQGLGAKSLLLAWMVILLLTLRWDHRSAPRTAASSGPRPVPALLGQAGCEGRDPRPVASGLRPMPPDPRWAPRSR